MHREATDGVPSPPSPPLEGGAKQILADSPAQKYNICTITLHVKTAAYRNTKTRRAGNPAMAVPVNPAAHSALIGNVHATVEPELPPPACDTQR